MANQGVAPPSAPILERGGHSFTGACHLTTVLQAVCEGKSPRPTCFEVRLKERQVVIAAGELCGIIGRRDGPPRSSP